MTMYFDCWSLWLKVSEMPRAEWESVRTRTSLTTRYFPAVKVARLLEEKSGHSLLTDHLLLARTLCLQEIHCKQCLREHSLAFFTKTVVDSYPLCELLKRLLKTNWKQLSFVKFALIFLVKQFFVVLNASSSGYGEWINHVSSHFFRSLSLRVKEWTTSEGIFIP